MSEVQESGPLNRGAFLKNAAKGGIVLATSGGILASVEGVAFAKGTTKSDITTLQAAYTAESLAVVVYTAILENFGKFRHPRLQNKDYFVAALQNEKDHKAFLGKALGAKKPDRPEVPYPGQRRQVRTELARHGRCAGDRIRRGLPRRIAHPQLG